MKPNKLNHLPTDWTGNHDRIVLYADIMGFKAMLKSMSHSTLVTELKKFIGDICKRLSPYQTAGHLRMTLFSDLVVIAADRCTPKNFSLIIKAASALMQECHTKNYPINGCISCGPLSFDEPPILTHKCKYKIKEDEKFTCSMKKSDITNIYAGQYMPLFVGQSIVDSHLLTEDLFCYGLTLHKSAQKFYIDHEADFKNDKSLPLYYLPIPLKSGGNANLYYLNWPEVKLAANTAKLEDVEKWLKDLEKNVDVRPRAYIFNTLNIVNAIKTIKAN